MVIGQEKINKIPQEMKDILTSWWVWCSKNEELLKSATPVTLEMKAEESLFLKKYPLSLELKGRMWPITEFLKVGIFTPCNIPLLPQRSQILAQRERQFLDLSNT